MRRSLRGCASKNVTDQLIDPQCIPTRSRFGRVNPTGRIGAERASDDDQLPAHAAHAGGERGVGVQAARLRGFARNAGIAFGRTRGHGRAGHDHQLRSGDAHGAGCGAGAAAAQHQRRHQPRRETEKDGQGPALHVTKSWREWAVRPSGLPGMRLRGPSGKCHLTSLGVDAFRNRRHWRPGRSPGSGAAQGGRRLFARAPARSPDAATFDRLCRRSVPSALATRPCPHVQRQAPAPTPAPA